MKPGRWWRAQDSCVDNAKLILLGDKAFRNWFNLNCIASSHGGVLPDLQTVAVKLRVSQARAAAAIAELVTKRLYDKREDGTFVPHDWDEWQFKTDLADPTNAERQKALRLRRKQEREELLALRDNAHNALRNGKRNGVTSVTAKRPETETDIITTTVSEDTGVGSPKERVGGLRPLLSAAAVAAVARKQ